MKIVLMSDLHLIAKTPNNRCDDILHDQWKKLEFVLSYCKKNQIYHLLQAGDFFDIPRNWETLHQTISLLQKYPSVKIYCVEGQHDRYMRNEDTVTNISLLHRLGFITLLKNSIHFGKFVLHGINFEDDMNIDKALDEIELSADDYNILVIHAPISDAPLFPGHEFSKANLLIKKHKEFDLILCGDIHKSFLEYFKGRAIVNTGSMIRRERNKYNETHTPKFMVVDLTNSVLTWESIPHNPFVKAFSQQEIIIESEVLKEFVEAILSPVSDEMDIFKRIERFINENSIDNEIHKIIMEVSGNEG